MDSETSSRGMGRRLLRRLGKGTVVLAMGAAMALFVFLALPLLQIITEITQNELTVREVATMQPPPPPPPMTEPPPPEEPPEEEQKPELQDTSQPLSLSDLSDALNDGGGGSGAAIMNNALLSAASVHAQGMFSSTDLDKKPRPIQQVPPRFPPGLRRDNPGGVVELVFVVDAQGRVINPRVEKTPDPAFGTAALEAIKKWRFEPGEKDGVKVPFKMRIPIRFSAG